MISDQLVLAAMFLEISFVVKHSLSVSANWCGQHVRSIFIHALLEDILAGNEQLASELAFDIRKFEEMLAVEQAEQLAASVRDNLNVSGQPAAENEQGEFITRLCQTLYQLHLLDIKWNEILTILIDILIMR